MKTQKFKGFVFYLLVISFALSTIGAIKPLNIYRQQVVSSFSHPLGFQNHILYEPRVTNDRDGSLIEDTDYGVKHPDLDNPSTCFGADWRELYHAGEDLYYPDRNIDTAGYQVTAIANGIVTEITPPYWPGFAVVIKHTLPSGQEIYSVYMHLENLNPSIQENLTVEEGQILGEVIHQDYSGNYPEYHRDAEASYIINPFIPEIPDSHLHFEIRYFADANTIYSQYPNCIFTSLSQDENISMNVVGKGYTPPNTHPDNFPVTGQGYTDPTDFINNFSLSSYTPTPTPTLSTSQTTSSSITQGSNDGGINPTPCEFTLEDNEVYLGACFDSGDITSGFRFENVQVPRNANIKSAYVRFTVDGEYTTPIQVQINGEASGNPLLYSEASPPTNRVPTYSSTFWSISETWNLAIPSPVMK